MNTTRRAVLYAIAAFGLFSTHDAIIKSLGGQYSPFQIVFFSVLLGFPLVTIMLLRDQTVGTLIPKYPGWTIFRTLAAVITAVCAFYAFSVLPLAQTYAIIFASPLMITLLAIPILGEKVGLRRGLAVLVGLAGVLVVLNPGATQLTIGHLAALGCAVAGALASIIVRKIGREERAVVLLIYPMVTNFLLMGALLPFVYEPMPLMDLAKMLLVAVLGVLAGSCLIRAYTHGQAAVIAPMQYSQILWATLYGALFFGETPTVNTAIGAGIIVLSGLYIVMRESKGGQSENTPVLRTRSRIATPSAPRLAPFVHLREERAEADEPARTTAKPNMRGLPGRGGRR